MNTKDSGHVHHPSKCETRAPCKHSGFDYTDHENQWCIRLRVASQKVERARHFICWRPGPRARFIGQTKRLRCR